MKFIQLLHRYLYGLKQSESMSYNQLRKYLLKEGYEMILFVHYFYKEIGI